MGIFLTYYNIFARLGGLEPTACGLEDRCSIQLSYRRNIIPRRRIDPLHMAPDTIAISIELQGYRWYFSIYPYRCQLNFVSGIRSEREASVNLPEAS